MSIARPAATSSTARQWLSTPPGTSSWPGLTTFTAPPEGSSPALRPSRTRRGGPRSRSTRTPPVSRPRGRRGRGGDGSRGWTEHLQHADIYAAALRRHRAAMALAWTCGPLGLERQRRARAGRDRHLAPSWRNVTARPGLTGRLGFTGPPAGRHLHAHRRDGRVRHAGRRASVAAAPTATGVGVVRRAARHPLGRHPDREDVRDTPARSSLGSTSARASPTCRARTPTTAS